MPQEKRPLSQVVPVLVAVLVCDIAVTDPSTGKQNLIGIFDRIFVGNFPTKRQLSVYIKLTDAEGYYEVDVRFVQVGTGKILAGAKGNLSAKDRLKSTDVHIEFPPLPIPEEGRYEFQIWTNSAFLGNAFIDALQRKAGKEGK